MMMSNKYRIKRQQNIISNLHIVAGTVDGTTRQSACQFSHSNNEVDVGDVVTTCVGDPLSSL
jgi:hypothetical protein